MISIKRVYTPPSPDDGTRLLVDRLWPRGISKEKAHLDGWLKDAAPSDQLRKWFGHDAARWPEFEKQYLAELAQQGERLLLLFQAYNKKNITLVYAAKDTGHNNAIILKEYLDKNLTKAKP